MSEATLAAEAMTRVGPGGGYLGEKETARRIRAGEHLRPAVSNRLSYDKWVADGRTELDLAAETVAELLAAHEARGPLLPADQLDQLAAICRADPDAVRRARRE